MSFRQTRTPYFLFSTFLSDLKHSSILPVCACLKSRRSGTFAPSCGKKSLKVWTFSHTATQFIPSHCPQHAPSCLANLYSSPLAVKLKKKKKKGQKSISHVLVVGLSSPSLTCEPQISFQLTFSVGGWIGKKGLHFIRSDDFCTSPCHFHTGSIKTYDLLHTNLRTKG